MTMVDIQGHLLDWKSMGGSVPQTFFPAADAVTGEITLRQNRPLDGAYLIVYLDAARLKVRRNGPVMNKDVYLAFGETLDGTKDIPGMRISGTEETTFRLQRSYKN
jgi:transposase-like protein